MIAMVIIFTVFYAKTISRVGFAYQGAVLVPSQENGSTVYAGKIKGEQASFTVTQDQTVVFQYGDKTYGPYTVKKDSTALPKAEDLKEEAKLETHNQFIDIQIPLSGVEVMGYTAREDLPEADYDADKDISFYPGLAESYIPVKPGMFAIFFPQDAHAPGVSPDGVKKVIVKVLV